MRDIPLPIALSKADAVSSPRLIVEKPGMSRVTYELQIGETSVGRGRDCEIILVCPEVEPHHFRIRRGETYCAVEDTTRESVTLVNGVRISERQVLNHADIIQAGSVMMEFQDGQQSQTEQSVPNRDAKVRLKGQVVTEIPLRDGLVFGRGDETDVELEDPAVSRRHCQIIKDNGGFRIKDLGSRLGVFLNAEKTVEAELLPGDRVQIGQFHFRNAGSRLVRIEDSGGGMVCVVESGATETGSGVTITAGELVAVYGNTAPAFLDAIQGCPAEFRASINGVSAGSDTRRVSEHGDLQLESTVREAVTFRTKLALPGADCKRLIASVISKLELDGREDVRLKRLTPSEFKRACIAAEWVRRPNVLLLDFPFSNLDLLEADRLMVMLRELVRGGCTVIYTTRLNELFAHVNRLVVVRDGIIVTATSPGETPALFAVSAQNEIPAALAAGVMPQSRTGVEKASSAVPKELARKEGPWRIGALLGREWRRLRQWNLLWFVGPALLLAALASFVAVDWGLPLFTAYIGALWFGLINGGMSMVEDRKLYIRHPEVSPASYLFSKFLFAFMVALGQSLLLYLVLLLWNMGLPGSMPWQLTAIILSAAAGTSIGIAVSSLASSRLMVAGVMPLILAACVFLSGYVVPAHAMRPVSSMLGSLTPGHAAQRLVDVSVLWDRRMNTETRREFPTAVMNVFEKQRGEDRFRQWRPCLAGIIVLVFWIAAGIGVAMFAISRDVQGRFQRSKA